MMDDTLPLKTCAPCNSNSAKTPALPVSRQVTGVSVRIFTQPAEILRKAFSSSGMGVLSKLPFAGSIEKNGEQFFQTGRLLVITLGMFIDAVKELRFSSLERFYAQQFSGNTL